MLRKIVKIDEAKCDGCGECVPSCAEGAIAIVDGKARLVGEVLCDGLGACLGECPQGAITVVEREAASRLGQWPVQLQLVQPHAPFFKGADLLVAADCVPFAYARFHDEFLDGRAVVVGCPKLDDVAPWAEKLAAIIAVGGVKSVTVVRMEVPCCSGISRLAREAIATAGSELPFRDVIVGTDGQLRGER
jgi:Pyruvate/2-oxoacid:ferredoxin oxidoreductase delta subunit